MTDERPLVAVDLFQYTGKKGGIETYVSELYGAFNRDRRGFRFIGFASRELADNDYSWFPGDIIITGHSGENRVDWAISELFRVSKLARKVGADLIHCPAMLGPIKSPVPLVLSIHDLLYYSHPELMTTDLYTEPVKWMERQVVRQTSRVITISDVSRQDILRHLRFPADRIDLIPLAGRTQQLPDEPPARKPHSLLAVGQRRPHKNFETIIRAMALIPAEQRPQLTITGSYAEDPLAPLVAELGLENWIDLKSWVSREELEDLFATSTFLVDASFNTGFSLPTLESMMRGMPVLLSDTPIFREVGGDAARYFNPNDAHQLADVITELVSTPAELERMSRDGVVWSSRFSWDTVADLTAQSFRDALAQPRGR